MPRASRRITTETILKYAKEQFLDEVEELLDDPSPLVESRGPDGVARISRHVLTRYYTLAAALGYDFENLIKDRGSTYEQERLRRILASEPSDQESMKRAAAKARQRNPD